MLIPQLLEHIKAQVFNPSKEDISTLEIQGIKPLATAEKKHLSFYDGSVPIESLMKTKASVILVKEKIEDLSRVQLITENPKLAMCLASQVLLKKEIISFEGISSKAYIHPEAHVSKSCTIYPMSYIDKGAKVGPNTIIYPHCFIGENVSVGQNSTLHPSVTVLKNSTIGNHVTIHPGVVIGSDGFGFIPTGKEIVKVPQEGHVEIQDHVQIGSLCNIDSATFEKTVVKKGSKLDAFVQVAHNVTVGEQNILCAQVGVAGGATLGDHVIAAGQAGVNSGISLASHTTLGAKAGAVKSLSKGVYQGFPAIKSSEWKRAKVMERKLPKLLDRIRDLEARIQELEKTNISH